MKPSMFTVKGWMMLPVALVLRVPFMLIGMMFGGIARVAKDLEKHSMDVMNMMPGVEYNPNYVSKQQEEARRKIAERFARG